MNPILSIERTALDGTVVSHHLHSSGPGSYTATAVTGSEEKTIVVRAGTASEAIARTPALRRVDGCDATRIHVHDATAISRGDLLDALRPTNGATDLDHWADDASDYDAVESWPHDIDVAAQRWSTWHRVEVDGVAVYGLRLASGRVVLVDADSAERPFDGWTELLATSWESSDYSAVGMSGYGIDGLYLVRPGLLATAHYDDENLEVRVERVSRRASAFALVRARAQRVAYSHRHRAQLVLAAHGVDTSDVCPSDTVTSCLDPRELHRLLPPLSDRPATSPRA